MPDRYEICFAKGWFDVTHELGAGSPMTLARPDGFGVLQVSVAFYAGGVEPNPSSDDLQAMVLNLLSQSGAEETSDVTFESNRVGLAAASACLNGNFVRAWYLSDGRHVAKITYTAKWGDHHAELVDCESMVRTLRFD